MPLACETEAALARIEAQEDQIAAFVPGTFDAGRVRGELETLGDSDLPLAGLLVGVKDIIRVEGLPTRCGAELPAALFAGPEASCVSALRRAGALITGKTVTTEFAVSHPGPTRNPRNLDHTPGGSSSGSAAAVAAGFCPLALGSQTVGSTIRPAAYCGVVGFKPSLGRVPLDGVVPYSWSLDHIGLIADRLDRLAPAMAVLTADWQAAAPLGEITLGIPEGAYLDLAAPAARDHFETTLARLAEAGVRIERVPMLDQVDRLNEQILRLTYGEAYRVHRAWLEDHRALYRASTLEGLDLGARVSDDELDELRAVGTGLRAALEDRMAGIDAWAAPAAPDVAPEGLAWTGDYAMNGIWTYAGLPNLTLPSGTDRKSLPYGLQLAGAFGADEALLQVARRVEDLLNCVKRRT
ncbi:MAG: amidase [Pseudomonadota bacterium]